MAAFFSSSRPASRFGIAFVAVLLVIGFRAYSAQSLDLDANGLDDIWELTYHAEGADPDADSDTDGVPNQLESIAGTDPFYAGSLPRISQLVVTTNGAQATMAGALGKFYQLQACEVVCGSASSNWLTEASMVARTNPTVSLTAPANLPAKFFRMIVSDVDTDGDGLTDWEEYQLGLDPLSATSNGESDVNGRLLSDLRYIKTRLQLGTTHGAEGTKAAVSLAIYPEADAMGGSGLTGEYFTNSSATYASPVNFNPTNLFLTTNDAVIDFRWGPATFPNLSNSFVTVRWTGQIEPPLSEDYTFETRTDDGAKLWVNDQLVVDKWQIQGTASWVGLIPLKAGVRYNIRMEYFNRGGSARAQLYWTSPSHPRQIIPTGRLYPASGGLAPGAITSPLKAFAFLGQPFTYTVTAANTPLGFVVSNLPPGLSFNSTNNVISGIPTLSGTFDVSLTASNVVGSSTSTLSLDVIDTGSAVTREIWLGATGTNVANIPLNLPASETNALGTLEGITNFGDNYGERIRGYLTAPVTGNYYFWIAANNSAELWISNDSEPVNKVRRAFVSKSTAPYQWNAKPNQRSPWLALEAGKRYYIEILHKAGKGANDHWSVGWLQDSTGTNALPASIVPGYVLSPYTNTPPAQIPGTLYSANMVAQSGAVSSGVGSATLRVSADGAQAVLRYSHSGLSTAVTAKHIHADTYLGKNPQGQIIFDIDAATPEPDGSYVWNIGPSGTLSAADILEIIKEGKSYLNVHTVNYPGGEINGHFGLADGTMEFTPPPPPPAWTDDHSSSNAAARFLQQATFGSSLKDIKAVRTLGYEAWINNQFKLSTSGHLTNVLANPNPEPFALYPGTHTFNTWWKHSVTAPDQLRQRVAFALSEIMVVSENVLEGNSRGLSSYYDTLLKHSFGNFRDLLEDVTLSSAMGIYLDMRRNEKGNPAAGTHPNENYAREILQLFSIGLNRMWPDGTLVLNSQGDLVPTYSQDVIIGYSRVFTGWNYHQPLQANKRLPTDFNPPDDFINPMTLVPPKHELGTKLLLDNTVLPAAQGSYADPASTNFDFYCSQDLELALDAIFRNENTGPFICRQLIQRLVTSHPSRDYVYRVVQKFNDNGSHVRGDMKAVIKAILLDYEARSVTTAPTFGKQREPLLRATAVARAFPAPTSVKASFTQKNSQMVTVVTEKAHRLTSSDDVVLTFTGNSAPSSQVYNNVNVTGPKTFTLNAPGIVSAIYGQSGTTITVSNVSHGVAVGYRVYLAFTSGGAQSGAYIVDSIIDGGTFTVTAASSATRAGNCLYPRWTGGGSEQHGTKITVTTTGPHALKTGNNVYIVFSGGLSPNGVYQVTSVPAAKKFTVNGTASEDRFDSGLLLFPLAAPPINRSGTVTLRYNSWNMNYTDNGFSSSLGQTPLNSPTVFNFFFPDYKFQGMLASANLTTPEFQLTSDSGIVLQMNFLSSAIFNNNSNTNGLSSFTGGNGSIALDISPWMTPARTSDAAIPALVDELATLLCAGQLSPAVKTNILNYVANPRFPYSIPTPSSVQMRDRVRAVVHLIVTSPEFAIQR